MSTDDFMTIGSHHQYMGRQVMLKYFVTRMEYFVIILGEHNLKVVRSRKDNKNSRTDCGLFHDPN